MNHGEGLRLFPLLETEMELIALVPISRLGLAAGDRFTANARDGRILKAIGKAKDAPAETEEAEEHAPAKGEYKTRDMTAKKKK